MEHGNELLTDKNHPCLIVMRCLKIKHTLYLEGNLNAIQIISEDENIKSLQSHANNENKKLSDLLKSLEVSTLQILHRIFEDLVKNW